VAGVAGYSPASGVGWPRKTTHGATHFFDEHFESYRTTISRPFDSLQGSCSQPGSSYRFEALPARRPRFASLEEYIEKRQLAGDALDWAFECAGTQDRAKHLATLYLNDLADVIRMRSTRASEFVRYAESLAASQPAFDQLQRRSVRRTTCRCIPACTDTPTPCLSINRTWC